MSKEETFSKYSGYEALSIQPYALIPTNTWFPTVKQEGCASGVIPCSWTWHRPDAKPPESDADRISRITRSMFK